MTRVQSEITRIKSNIASALSKLATKGVTVPSNANSDDLPSLIESVKTASELPRAEEISV